MNSYNIKEKQNVKDDDWDIYSSNLPLVLSDEQWCYDLFHMSEFGKPADWHSRTHIQCLLQTKHMPNPYESHQDIT
jgi:hypothetical protein